MMNQSLSLLIALVFSFASLGAVAAIPKAAENESAAVTYGAETPRPKKAKATHANPTEKKRATKAKLVHKARHGKPRS